MRTLLLAATTLVIAAGANAAPVLTDGFDGENGGVTALNYDGFANFITVGQVDLVASGDFGIVCAGGAGACVDLDGTTGPGTLFSNAFTVAAGDRITLSFDASGNQRGGGIDDLFAAFLFGVDPTISDLVFTGLTSDSNDPAVVAGSTTLASGDAFSTFSISFTIGGADEISFIIGTNSGDNVGPILDNVNLDVAPADVPAPAALALFGLGVAAIGFARRR